MTTREDLGYNRAGKTDKTCKTNYERPQQLRPEEERINQAKRQEIKDWAEKRAYEDAKRLGRVRSETDYEAMRAFDAYISSQSLEYERQAYLKIKNRESKS